jgi:hypothetical protein
MRAKLRNTGRRVRRPAAGWWALLAAVVGNGGLVAAQDVRYETGPDGARYRVTTHVVREPIPATAPAASPVAAVPQNGAAASGVSYQMVAVPVTQYQLVQRLESSWNPFQAPYWTYQYEPVTTWQYRRVAIAAASQSGSASPRAAAAAQPPAAYRAADATWNRSTVVGAAPGYTSAPQVAVAAPRGPSATIVAMPSGPGAATVAQAPYAGAARPATEPTGQTGWPAAPATQGWPAAAGAGRYR